MDCSHYPNFPQHGVDIEECKDDIPNPLLKHLIVTKILSSGQFNVKELKQFRTVCTLWYALSLDHWRKSVCVRIIESENTTGFLEQEEQQTQIGVSIKELCCHLEINNENKNQSIYQLPTKPYSNYKMKGWTAGYLSNLAKEELNLWANVLAPHVITLKIEGCYFPDSKQIEEKLFACVNLEELELVGNSSGICRGYKIPTEITDELPVLGNLKKLTVSGAMPMQWSKLLMHTPCLKNLTIKQNGSYHRTTFASFLLDLHQLEFAGRNPQNIKHLDIMDADDTFTDFVSLSSRDLKLESLSAHFEKIRPEHFMQPLLQAQARTLKVLKLCRVSNRLEEPFGQFDFPYSVYMPNLKELYLWGNMVRNLEFLRYTPNLKKLFISRDRLEKKNSIRFRGSLESGVAIPQDLILGQNEIPEAELVNRFTMTDMSFLHVDNRFSPDSLKILKSWMPNLQSIATVLTNETLKLVCDQWPFIKKITYLCGSDLNDNAISNIGKERVFQFEKPKSCGNVNNFFSYNL